MKSYEGKRRPAESNGSLLPGLWRDSLHVTCGLTACTPGSAPGPMLGNEYGKTLPLPYTLIVVHATIWIGEAQWAESRAASPLPISQRVWGNAVSSVAGVQGTAPASMRFSCILETQNDLSWKLLGAKFGGGMAHWAPHIRPCICVAPNDM